MPVLDDKCPVDLRDAFESMERTVQSFKRDLPYKAPEIYDRAWGEFQMQLAYVIQTLYDRILPDDSTV